jgi:hypothetical protein
MQMQQSGVNRSCRQATDARLLALTLELRESVDDDVPGLSSARGGSRIRRGRPSPEDSDYLEKETVSDVDADAADESVSGGVVVRGRVAEQPLRREGN